MKVETLETLDENIEKLSTETNNNEQKNNETNKGCSNFQQPFLFYNDV